MKDRTGQVFGRLTITSFSHIVKNAYYWNCTCECGNIKIVQYGNLQSKQIVSCGCYKNTMRITHGLHGSRLYNIYEGMIARCYDFNSIQYKDYGGKGIKVCDEWKNDRSSFFTWALINGYSDNLQLDREKNNEDYSPSNCRFVTRSVNCRNKSNNIIVEYKGESKPLITWCEELSLDYNLMRGRIKRGWSSENAFTQYLHYRPK